VTERLLWMLGHGAARPAFLADVLHVSEHSVRTRLGRLRAKGRMIRLDNGQWGAAESVT
jgi:predicted transcriptional regulator of viral defense system